jgi:hypothetical protein
MAVSFPKGGETTLIKNPDRKYQSITMPGPIHPTNSDSFLENIMMSRSGFEKFG